MSYIDEVPVAREFTEDIMRDWEPFRLFDQETFAGFVAGVLSATNVDSKGESVDVDSLREAEEQIKAGPLWINDNHNPLKPPVGRVISAKVFHSPVSNVYFLAGVAGIYETTLYPKFSDLGIDISKHLLPNELLLDSDEEPYCHLLCDPHDIPPDLIEELLSDAPPFVTPTEDTLLHKGETDLSHLTILASHFLLAFNPLTKKMLETIGQSAGEAFVNWSKQSVAKISSRVRRRVLFSWKNVYLGCNAEFLVECEDPTTITTAMEQAVEASSAAGALVRSLMDYEPERVTYLFDARLGKWVPLYAVTRRRGVISDRPFLMAVENFKGFSIGGTAVRK